MNKSKSAKNKNIRKHLALLAILAAALVMSVAILSWATYRATPHKKTVILAPKSKPGYVDGDDATRQVENFYHQYLNPNTKPAFLPRLIEAYGTKNLVFYSQYYQHGFDPITCSTIMPVKATASLVSTGPVATVNANLEYPDNTKATVTARVVVNDGGLQIDSLTCPREKGNLPPAHTQ